MLRLRFVIGHCFITIYIYIYRQYCSVNGIHNSTSLYMLGIKKMLAFCDRRQKKSQRDCADQFTKVIIKTTTFFHDGFKTILKEKSQFPENKANTIGIRIKKKKKKLNFYTSCTAVNIFHSLIKKITQGLQMHACRMQMYVT